MMHAGIASLWASETLQQRGGQLSAEMARDLVILATGDEDEADEVYAQRKAKEAEFASPR